MTMTLVYRLLRTPIVHDNPIQVHKFRSLPVHWPVPSSTQHATSIRAFSIMSSAQHPRRGRGPFRSRFTVSDAEPVKKAVIGDPEAQKVQTRLEAAAELVSRVDDQFVKSLGTSAETQLYIRLVLSRILPILEYSLQHTDHEFLMGYGPVGSSLDRARDAATYLFISASAWANVGYAASNSRSENLDAEILEAISKFHKAGSIIESYLEETSPDGVTWSNVGGEILATSRLAWPPMVKYLEATIRREEPDDSPVAEDSARERADSTIKSDGNAESKPPQ